MNTLVKKSFNKNYKQPYTSITDALAQSLQENQQNSIGLLAGLSGEVVSLMYCAQLTQNQSYYDLAYSSLQKTIKLISTNPISHTHCTGLAGFGWAIMHLHKHDLLDIDVNNLLKEVDPFLEKSIIIDMQNGNWDFLHGAIGTALYFLKRKEYSAKADKVLQLFINTLEAQAVSEKNYIKWPAVGNPEKPIIFNISLSHGMSAIVAFLSKVYKEEIECRKVKKMIQETVNYILLQQLDPQKYTSNFPPYSIESHKELISSRLAWCYGDLGIASALWMAGEALNNREWKEKAVDIFLHATTRKKPEDTDVNDSGLCHGTTGIAHIFNRTYHNTGVEKFAIARNYWLNKTKKMAIYEDGLAGYKTWNRKDNRYIKETSLLEGIAGIGLAFMSATDTNFINWDECLLLS
jgi:lantibiotic biosynthesis protein